MLALEHSTDCDQCGRSMTKAKKVHADKRYCATCYARLFKRRLCSGCGNFSRLPVFDDKAVCSRCLIARPCVRCARLGRPVGKLTEYGPACNSCAHYFNVPEPCERCAALSTRLVRTAIDSQMMRCCPRCARVSARTCPMCRHHRFLVMRVDGKEVCRRCAESESSKCSGCHREIPGGRGLECEDCYWSRTFQKRLMLDANALRSEPVMNEFLAFGSWLPGEIGHKRAALSIHRDLNFFITIDEQWGVMPDPDQLLRQLGIHGIRQARVPLRWFASFRGYVISEELREQHVERERIQQIMATMSCETDSALLRDYLALLGARVNAGSLKLRSLCGKLRTAADLITMARSEGQSRIDQGQIDRLLRIKPGVAANLWGFITFLNGRRAGLVALGIDQKKTDSSRRSKLELQMIKLAVAARSGRDVQRPWITKSLAYFHRLHPVSANGVTATADPEGNGFSVTLDGVTYWVPDPRSLSLVQTKDF